MLKIYHPLNTSANCLFRQENLSQGWSPFSSLKKKKSLSWSKAFKLQNRFSFLLDIFFQVCLFRPLLTTRVPLVQLINNVFYCSRQPVLPNIIAGKAWRDCKVQVFGALWSSKPDAEEMEHLFPFFPALENTALCKLQKQPEINSSAAVFP